MARSRAVHSHSRRCRKAICAGKVSLLRVVSIWKTLTPLAAISRPMRQFDECSSECSWSMKEREWRMVAHVVVVAQAAVAGQPGGDALVAAVHGDQVDVDVDQQIGLGRPLVDLHVLALVGLAQVDQAVGVLGVVLEQQPVRGEGVVDPVADGVAQLGFGHAPVQGQGADEHHVVDPGRGGHVEHGFDDPLAVVGALHRRQRQGDVVEGDGEPHARRTAAPAAGAQSPSGWSRASRMASSGSSSGVEGLGGVDDPGPPGGQPLEAEPLAVPGQDRRGGAVDVEDESGAGHDSCGFLSSLLARAGRRPP